MRRQAFGRAFREIGPGRWVLWTGLLGVCAFMAYRSRSAVDVVCSICAWCLVGLSELRGRQAFSEKTVYHNVLTTTGLVLLASATTGGLQSGLAAGIPMMAVLVAILLPRPIAWAGLGLQIGAIFAMDRAHAEPSIGRAIVFCLWVCAATGVGFVIDRVLVRTLRELARSRTEAIEAHREQMHDLTALTGEIAHELKNPLASVKSLAALVAKSMEGRSGERMAVLREEVDRVIDRLESLLGLTRPVGPLAREASDLGILCEDVGRLHEGMAADRGVSLAWSGGARAACDRRKVKQILTNLVQNALDAAPRGSEVTMRAFEAGGDANVEVRDRGPGLSPDVRDRLFLRGATNKASGSGIGLTVARAIARAHGGDLTLQDHEAGGATARLRLPISPPRGAGDANEGDAK